MTPSCALQAMTLMAWRLSKLYEEGKMSHAMASNVKVLHCAVILTGVGASTLSTLIHRPMSLLSEH